MRGKIQHNLPGEIHLLLFILNCGNYCDFIQIIFNALKINHASIPVIVIFNYGCIISNNVYVYFVSKKLGGGTSTKTEFLHREVSHEETSRKRAVFNTYIYFCIKFASDTVS